MNVLLTTLHSRYIHAGLALSYLSAYCRSVCRSIAIVEFTLHQPKEIILARIVAAKAQVVCFSVYLWNRTATLELVRCLKLIDSDLRIVLGGPEISYEDSDFFRHYPVDAIVCGEGEVPFRHLLDSWSKGCEPPLVAGLQLPGRHGPPGEYLLETLDEIPSPFVLDLVDLNRGLVYFETSRGCPYRCSFCLSSLSRNVRSFSMERIKSDLALLFQKKVNQIKFVDRTFNYDPARAREIFRFILENCQNSSCHFEIGAHLLDEETLLLLEQVPEGLFQFEIGVQSILPRTLTKVSRPFALGQLATRVRQLRERTRIHLHLDLVAGLPGETREDFFRAIDWTFALEGDHLQIEPVKLLPGTPLRRQAERLAIRFDPAPPYTVLATAEMSFDDLNRIGGISRLNDLLVNSGKFPRLMTALKRAFGSLSRCLDELNTYWTQQNLHGVNRSLRELAEELDRYLSVAFHGNSAVLMRESLARDYAHCERIVAGSAPEFFDQSLADDEQIRVRERVKQELTGLQRAGKVQFFSSVFKCLPDAPGRRVLIFLYIAKTRSGLVVKEFQL